jgi:hypothetical protein
MIVYPGQVVSKGQRIGYMGNTGLTMAGLENYGFVPEEYESIVARIEGKIEAINPGFDFSPESPDGQLIEAIELPVDKHPFFVAVQFHPEYKSNPLSPHPLFLGLIKTVLDLKK